MSSTPTPPVPPTPQPAAAAPAAAPETPPQSFSFRHWVQNLHPIVKGAFLVILIALAVAWYIFNGRVTTDDAQVDCHITAIAPQVPGYVVDLLINDNTSVKVGDLLVQVDPREYEAEVAQSKANLEFAEAQANSAKIQIGLTRETTTNSTHGASAQKDSDAADYVSSQAQLEQSATANLQVAEANVEAKKPPTNAPKPTWRD